MRGDKERETERERERVRKLVERVDKAQKEEKMKRKKLIGDNMPQAGIEPTTFCMRDERQTPYLETTRAPGFGLTPRATK